MHTHLLDNSVTITELVAAINELTIALEGEFEFLPL